MQTVREDLSGVLRHQLHAVQSASISAAYFMLYRVYFYSVLTLYN